MGQVTYEFTMLLSYDWGNNHPLTSYDMGSVWVPFGHRFDPKPYGPQWKLPKIQTQEICHWTVSMIICETVWNRLSNINGPRHLGMQISGRMACIDWHLPTFERPRPSNRHVTVPHIFGTLGKGTKVMEYYFFLWVVGGVWVEERLISESYSSCGPICFGPCSKPIQIFK
jgi:hypothetical protein